MQKLFYTDHANQKAGNCCWPVAKAKVMQLTPAL